MYMVYEAERRYREQVQTLIKSVVTKTYLLGIDYVSRAIPKAEIGYLTMEDITQIQLHTDEVYAMFWRSINRYLQVIRNRKSKLHRIALIRAQYAAVEEKESNDEAGTNITMSSTNNNSNPEDENTLLSILTTARLLLNSILTPIMAYSTIDSFRKYRQQQEEEQPTTVVFVTQKDERVCPICAPLHMREWEPNSIGIQIPRIHTHHRCRCRLLLKRNGKIISK